MTIIIPVPNVKGSDGVTIMRRVAKYADRGASIPIARYNEARLILAEADVAAGDLPGAVAIINALHSAVGLPAYNGAGQTAPSAGLVTTRAGGTAISSLMPPGSYPATWI